MPRIAEITILAMLVMLPTAVFQKTRRPRSPRNRAPIIQSFVSSRSVVALCPFVWGDSCSPSNIVTLEVKANDPDDDDLTYKYSVSAGAIAGSGAAVNWDLTKSRLGNHTASVEVTDQRGGKTSRIIMVDLVICGACDPPCPLVSVTCPTNVPEGQMAIFEATSGGDLSQKLTYLWSHSNGKRSAGQEGPTLKIEAIGRPGQVISATVEVLGLDPACSRQASCESTIAKPVP